MKSKWEISYRGKAWLALVAASLASWILILWPLVAYFG